ncbi:hypothetical protein F5148DRAFT_1324686 [Russula earlei]|uniref:Uncharacterized protein n=1 Tax=Russula earlei TaxID=71964 RepID=A0ACC0U004_9AGAM|nr:hypothetical protein F5148DRAFT_1324686 [Russula earlei]
MRLSTFQPSNARRGLSDSAFSPIAQPRSMSEFVDSQLDVEKLEGTRAEDHPSQPNIRMMSKEEFNFGDSSGPLYSVYTKIIAEEDAQMVERWQKDADSILVFTGLFSAAVAALLAVTIPDLRPSSQDTTNLYLQNMTQLLVDMSASRPSTVTAADSPPPFSPPRYTVWVNLFWFLSLCISLTCAVMATIVQQWARQYLRYTQPPQRSPRERARIRALFSESVDNLFIKSLGALLPCYLHLSVLLFLLGLVLFLFHVNHTIFLGICSVFGFSIVIYAFFTVLPIFQQDSLLYTPISALPIALWAFAVCYVRTIFRRRFNYKISRIFDWAFEDVGKSAKAAAFERSNEIDFNIFERSLNSLRNDNAVEEFLQAVPGFFSSTWVHIRPIHLSAQIKDEFKVMLNEFLDRTFQSNTIAEDVRCSRFIISLDASRKVLGPNEPSRILADVLKGKWPKLFRFVELGHSLIRWSNHNNNENALYIQGILSRIISVTENRNDRWIALAVNQLGISEDVLQKYRSDDNILPLVNFINIASRILRSRVSSLELLSPPPGGDVSKVCASLFCASWNALVHKAQTSADQISIPILKAFRHVYIGLHEGTEAFSAANNDERILDVLSYPSCKTSDHHPDPTLHGSNGATRNSSVSHPPTQNVANHGPETTGAPTTAIPLSLSASLVSQSNPIPSHVTAIVAKQ